MGWHMLNVKSDHAFTCADPDAEYYEQHGYVVARGAVAKTDIAKLLELYSREIVSSKYPFFRQNTNAYEANRRSESGYVRQSFLDVHDYQRFPDFSAAARDIFCSARMMATLERVTQLDSFALMQTMLFDLNTATPAHQDWYYLDSVPNGKLIAAWIALEDIAAPAGRFYVMPGTHRLEFGARAPNRTHAQWLEGIGRYVDDHREELTAPELFAGDVLFWNSRTVHGSLPTLNEAFSRKSLTAHYLPGGFDFGNLFSTKANIPFKSHMGVPYYRNQPDFSYWNRVRFAVKTRAYNYPRLREALRAARDALGGKSTTSGHRNSN
jgi:phytanoyl-CoA hydroxylase